MDLFYAHRTLYIQGALDRAMRLCPRELEKLKLHNVSRAGSIDVAGLVWECEGLTRAWVTGLDIVGIVLDGIGPIQSMWSVRSIHPTTESLIETPTYQNRQAGFLAQKRLARGTRLNYPGAFIYTWHYLAHRYMYTYEYESSLIRLRINTTPVRACRGHCFDRRGADGDDPGRA